MVGLDSRFVFYWTLQAGAFFSTLKNLHDSNIIVFSGFALGQKEDFKFCLLISRSSALVDRVSFKCYKYFMGMESNRFSLNCQ